MRVAIVTDSTANLSAIRARELGVTVVPLQIVFGDRAYTDGVELEVQEFYERLTVSDRLPSTSQPSVGMFAEVFSRLLESHDAILAILLSGKLSGTVASAQAARDLISRQRDVHVYDSQLVEYALGLQVEEAVRMVNQGWSVHRVTEALAGVRGRTRCFIVLDSLENLRRGGRIGGAAALIGSLLQVKPIITLRDGIVDVHEKVRTARRALEGLLTQLQRDVAQFGVSEVTIMHSSSPEAVDAFRAQVLAAAPGVRTREVWLSPIVGVHTGLGGLGLIYLCDEA